MSDRVARNGAGTRTLLIAALALCVAWLMIQNLLLLVLTPWPGSAALMGVARVLLRTGWVVVQQLWPAIAFTVGGSAFALWLVAGPARARRREVGDGHARS